MTHLITYILIIAGSEALAVLWFWLLAKLNTKNHQNAITGSSVLKGISERAFITFSLINGLPHALTVFAALKIATRIRDEDKISNDFYLLGNLLSITMAIVYSQLILKYMELN